MKSRLILFLLMFVLIVSISSCSGGSENNTPTTELTDVPEATVTPKPTIAATKEPEPTLEPLPNELLGTPQEDSRIIFEDNFQDDMPHDYAVFRFNDAHEIVDEQLYLSYKNGEIVNLAEAYAPDVYCEVKEDVNQVEYFITFKTFHGNAAKDKGYWMGAFVGVRVYEPAGGSFRPNDEDGGIYITFTQNDFAVLYHGNHNITGKKWEEGVVMFDLPVGFKEMQTLAIVDTGDKIFYYIAQEDSYTLFLTLELSSNKIKAFDAANELIYEADNNMGGDLGGYFKVFNHFGQTVIDNVIIKER